MIDINSIVQGVIVETVKPLIESYEQRINSLETMNRHLCTAIMGDPENDDPVFHVGIVQKLESQRQAIEALVKRAPVDTDSVDFKNLREDFERLNQIVGTVVNGDIEDGVPELAHQFEDKLKSVIDQRMSDHCNEYDHSHLDEEKGPTSSKVRQMVKNMIDNDEITIRLEA